MYASYYLNRATRPGSGISLLNKEHNKTELLGKFSSITNHYEILSVRTTDTIFALLYRTPDGDMKVFFYPLSLISRICKREEKFVSRKSLRSLRIR